METEWGGRGVRRVTEDGSERGRGRRGGRVSGMRTEW